MQISFTERLKQGWNAFLNRDPTQMYSANLGPSSWSRPDRFHMRMGMEKSIITSVYNRIAIDVASIAIQHVRLDQNGRYVKTLDSGLNTCLTLDANKDQTGRSFMQDIVMSMFDEGSVAIVPTDTNVNPALFASYEIYGLRTGKVVEWHPDSVKVNLYNDRSGSKQDVIISKRNVAIVENPLYAVMNESNSTLKRLISKLNLLDAIDKQSGSGKLDLIIQLPYVIKTALRKVQAETRRKDIETQLSGSKYGIAYTDGTERITQLNRPVENNLMGQIEFLTRMLYSQLGITEAVLDGTANEATMTNYHNRTVNPILSAIADEFKRKFLTKTARSQGQSIMFFKDPFGLVPASQLPTLADSLTRNAVLSPNEFRGVIGFKPSDQPDSDKLVNRNLKTANGQPADQVPPANPDVNSFQ